MKNLIVAAALGLSLTGCAGTTSMFSPGMADNNAGATLATNGNFSMAEARLNKALEADPNNPLVLNNLGYVYQRTGRPDQARAMYQRVIDQHSKQIPTTILGSNKGAVEAKADSVDTVAKSNLNSLNFPAPSTVVMSR